MNYFALITNGIVAEVFPEFIDVEFPEGKRPVDIEDRYSADFIATLVPYDPANPPVPPPVPPVTVAQVLADRDGRLTIAALRIAPLQDAVDLDEVTSAETAALKVWKQYRVALNRIETQANFPDDVNWPVAPGV